MNLDKYKPGQIITSMSRRVFLDLWEDIQSGAASKRWPPGKAAETKRERIEDLRIRTIAIIYEDYPDTFDMLLSSDDWKTLEIYLKTENVIHFRVMKDQTKEFENMKGMRHAMMKRRMP